MSVELSQRVSLFKTLYLFNTVEDADLEDVAQRFEVAKFAAGEVIIAQGTRADNFYIIFEGRVQVSRQVGNVDSPVDVLVRGDFFGEEALLTRRLRAATVTASTATTLLTLNEEQFFALLRQYPQIETSLVRLVESHRFLRKNRFDWLGEDEVIYQVRRKHIAYLFITLILPGIVVFIALVLSLVGLVSGPVSSLAISLYIASGLILLVGLAWGLWNWIDWGNDYYVVTDVRVVWIEQVIWLYESRVEAPLTTLLSVNVTTSFLGQILGYGNVIVRTFTGEIVFRTVGEPKLFAALVEEYWHRAQRRYKQAEEEEMERSVRRIVGVDDQRSAQPGKKSVPSKPLDYEELGFAQKYFGNIIKMRVEQGNVITYRKHWIVLFRKTWWPMLTIAVLVLALLSYDVLYVMDRARFMPPLLFNGAGIMLVLIIFGTWWLYNYADWRNDIYQVTDKNIFDIERKPLGTEVRKSASLENILSLEHTRPGLLGYLFNYGTVTINVGDAKFDFQGVHEPARIQQDIFSRMHEFRQQKEKAEVERERDRILTLLATYHRNVDRPTEL